jgi:hypothetical protein
MIETFCSIHPQELAVGSCGTCHRPTCYRCSMNMDDKVFCSLKCFNDLNPPSGEFSARRDDDGLVELADPSAPDLPLTLEDSASEPAVQLPSPSPLDEYSDVVLGMHAAAHAIAPPAPKPQAPSPASLLDADSSVILSAQAAHDVSETTILGMNPVRPPVGDGSTLILIPGTRRALISSSCFFHPDTSAIVLCARCRNPICSLCAQETPEGLTCTPSCGPPDPAGAQQRRKVTALNLLLGASIVIVLAGAVLLGTAWRTTNERLAAQLADLKAASTPAPLKSAPPDAAPSASRTTPLAPPAPKPVAVAAPASPVAASPKKTVDPAPAAVSRSAPLATAKPTPATVAPVRPVLTTSERAPLDARPALAPAVTLPAPVLPVKETRAPIPPAKISPPAETPEPAAPAALPSPAAKTPTPYELDLREAARLLRETEPLLQETAETMYPQLKPRADVDRLISQLQKGVDNLLETRDLYTQWLETSPDRSVLEHRLQLIARVLKDLYVGLDRLRSDGRDPDRAPR